MVWKLIVAVVVFLVIMRIGLFILRSLAQPIPPPPEPGTLRKVNLKYRCTICGAELKMIRASEELPDPPKHCMEEMQLEAPIT